MKKQFFTLCLLTATNLCASYTKAAPFADPALKSRAALLEYFKSHPEALTSINERVSAPNDFAEPYKSALKNLDLSKLEKAVEKNYFILRQLYCEDVVSSVVGEKYEEMSTQISAVKGLQGFSGGCTIDTNGDLVFKAYIKDESERYAILEKLAKVDKLVDFLGGTRFNLQAIGEFKVDSAGDKSVK